MKHEGIPTNSSPEQIRAWTDFMARMTEAQSAAERVGFGAWVLLTVVVLLIFRCNDVTLWPMPATASCFEVSP